MRPRSKSGLKDGIDYEMPDVLSAIVLSVVQGLTEFLPISSSAHLVLLGNILGVKWPGLTFEVLVHFGTLISVLWVFWGRVLGLVKAPFRGDGKNLKLLLLLGVGSVPIGVVGFFLADWVEWAFESTLAVGISLIITGCFLFVVDQDKNKKGIFNIGVTESLLIGIMQGVSVFPGISRSGFTIGAGLLLGMKREAAAEFSFLLSIPAILGATGFKVLEALTKPKLHQGLLLTYALGTALAFLFGVFAIRFLLGVLKKGRLSLFAYYCWVAGVVAIII
jgi:undecaprenyl-diphosphatase